jgi:hypothetical protein
MEFYPCRGRVKAAPAKYVLFDEPDPTEFILQSSRLDSGEGVIKFLSDPADLAAG